MFYVLKSQYLFLSYILHMKTRNSKLNAQVNMDSDRHTVSLPSMNRSCHVGSLMRLLTSSSASQQPLISLFIYL